MVAHVLQTIVLGRYMRIRQDLNVCIIRLIAINSWICACEWFQKKTFDSSQRIRAHVFHLLAPRETQPEMRLWET